MMTEHSGQQDPAEALRRTLSEHANQIHFHDSSLRSLSEQQTNQQLEQIASMLQQTLGTQSTTPVDGATTLLVSQQLPHSHSCDVTSPNPERFSGEVGNCGGFLLQCSLVFN
ncbi:hypothetical protein AMECASPLE_027410 [Ameca splendens]|uniref:Uncharacterized protein n=1 Tax=Ameca splendens TaxID=208324 RepID=A0ABV0YGN8_9TELE